MNVFIIRQIDGQYKFITSDTWTCSGRNSFLPSDSCWCTCPGRVSAACIYAGAAAIFWWRRLHHRTSDATRTTAAAPVQLLPRHLRPSRSRRRRRRRCRCCSSRMCTTTNVRWCPAVSAAAAPAAVSLQLPAKNPILPIFAEATNLNRTATDSALTSEYNGRHDTSSSNVITSSIKQRSFFRGNFTARRLHTTRMQNVIWPGVYTTESSSSNTG